MDNVVDDFSNDTGTTGVIVVGGTSAGAIELGNDSDWFAIELTAGEITRIGSGGRDADLLLRDAFGNIVVFDGVNSDSDETVLIAQVEESGTFYVDVSSPDAPLNYTLTSTVVEDDFTADTNTAGVLEVNGSVDATLDYWNDSDWFAIELTAGEAVRIASDEMFSDLVLRDALGNAVAFDHLDLTRGEIAIVARVEESGIYYIDYELGNVVVDYTLTATVVDDPFTDNIGTTGVLELDNTVSSALDFRNDEDWFAINITDTDAIYQFSVDNERVDLALYDADGDLFTSSVEGRSISFSEVGTYFVGADGSFVNFEAFTISSNVVTTLEATLSLEDAGIVDTVSDEMNNLTYSLTSEGTLIRYSNQTESRLPDLDLGVDTSALSLSLDGRFIFVAQSDLTEVGNGNFEATVLRINAETLDVETFTFGVSGDGFNITDVQAAANETLFVTTDRIGSGSTSLYNLSGFDGVFSANVVVDPASSFFNVRDNTALDISRDGQFLLLTEINSFSSEILIFSVEDEAILASTNHLGFDFFHTAISGEAGLVAVFGERDEVTVYDFDLNSVVVLTDVFENVDDVHPVFSRNGEFLLLVNEAADGQTSLAIVDTINFEIVSFSSLPQDISSIMELDLSADGFSLLVTDSTGVHRFGLSEIIDLPDTFAEPVEGTSASETLVGTVFNDVITGLGGNDILNGGFGDDILEGGAGADVLNGGEGTDTASYEGSTNRVVINAATNSVTSGHASGDSFVSIENFTGGNFNDVITGSSGNNAINGGNGFDVLSGFSGDDTLDGGAGRDVLTGGAGADSIDGGDGISDVVRYISSSEGVTVDLGAGTASGGEAEGDVLANIEQVLGSNHADVLTGSDVNNFLFGQNGDDILDGGAGIDKLFGGAGADTFVFGAGDGAAFVSDFEDNVDSIDLTQYAFASLEDALANFDQRGANVRFFVDGETLLILNTDLEDIADDIIIDETIV